MMNSDELCHSEDVTHVHVSNPAGEIGSTIMIDGVCYMKTGRVGQATHDPSTIESYNVSCSACEHDTQQAD